MHTCAHTHTHNRNNNITTDVVLTCGVKLDELQILARQAGAGHHGSTISCTSVG